MALLTKKGMGVKNFKKKLPSVILIGLSFEAGLPTFEKRREIYFISLTKRCVFQ